LFLLKYLTLHTHEFGWEELILMGKQTENTLHQKDFYRKEDLLHKNPHSECE